MSDDKKEFRVHPGMADVLARALTGQRPLRPVTPEQLAEIVKKLEAVEGTLDAIIEQMYLSDYSLDAGQLMGANRLVADVRKDLEGELPKPQPTADETPDHCPSCGIPLILVNENDPTGPAKCPHCEFIAPAYPAIHQ